MFFRADRCIKLAEFRNDVGHQEDQHARNEDREQSRVYERGLQLLSESHRHALKVDVAAQNFFEIAALLTSEQGSGIDLRECTLCSKGVG